MTRINPHIFEPFIDADGGEWIRIKSGTYKNVVWRPVDMQFDEEQEGKLNFKVEMLDGDGFAKVDENDKQFEGVCGRIIVDIFEATTGLNQPQEEPEKSPIIGTEAPKIIV